MKEPEITLYEAETDEEKQIHPETATDAESSIDLTDLEEDRYSRFRLITWWEQQKLRDTKMMVVGAGAIGNELLKIATLFGIGNLFIVDFDEIENSNLSRAILFRASDEGKNKAEVAAERIREINPDITVQPFNGNIVYDVGLGVFRRMDVVMGGLDNREARLGINRSCWKVNKPWIDGAIEVLNGLARVFVPPDSACYECTMTELDFKLLEMRRSCALLTHDELLQGKVPTTPTTASVIAGVQMQEAVKLIHKRPELPILVGKGFYFNGTTHDSFVIEYDRKEDCMSHVTYDNIIELNEKTSGITVGKMLEIVKQTLESDDAILEFDKEIVLELSCPQCNEREPIFRALGKVTEKEARCPNGCKEAERPQIRNPNLTHSVYGDEIVLDKTLAEIGIPAFDIVTGRVGLEKFAAFELTGDLEEALGNLAPKC